MHLCLKDKSTSNISVCVSSAFLEQANKLPAEETSFIANVSQLTRESGSGLGGWLASYDLSQNFCLRPTFCPNVSERCFHWNCCGCQTFLNEVGREGYFAFSNIRTPILPPDPSLPDPAPNPNRSRKRGGLSEDEGGENAAQYLPPADSDCAFADDT